MPPDRVVGRDEIIARMWQRLPTQSVRLLAERRIGKTSVLRKMELDPPRGWHPVYIAVQGVRSPAELAARIIRAVSPRLHLAKSVFRKGQALLAELDCDDFGDWATALLQQNWKRLLLATLADIEEAADGRVVLLLDEITSMVSSIARDPEQGSQVAADLLDTLRAYRQDGGVAHVRMVFTGSIGLHLVLSRLAEDGYADEPTNDMHAILLEGLYPQDAAVLARRGLMALRAANELSVAGDVDELAHTIAAEADFLPFYIDKTVLQLSQVEQPVTSGSVPAAVDALIESPEDLAEFEHYAKRIRVYYDVVRDGVPIAFALLDELSRADGPLDEDRLWQAVVTWLPLPDAERERMREVLRLLRKDHYLRLTTGAESRRWQFKYPLVRKWWLRMQAR